MSTTDLWIFDSNDSLAAAALLGRVGTSTFSSFLAAFAFFVVFTLWATTAATFAVDICFEEASTFLALAETFTGVWDLDCCVLAGWDLETPDFLALFDLEGAGDLVFWDDAAVVWVWD